MRLTHQGLTVRHLLILATPSLERPHFRKNVSMSRTPVLRRFLRKLVTIVANPARIRPNKLIDVGPDLVDLRTDLADIEHNWPKSPDFDRVPNFIGVSPIWGKFRQELVNFGQNFSAIGPNPINFGPQFGNTLQSWSKLAQNWSTWVPIWWNSVQSWSMSDKTWPNTAFGLTRAKFGSVFGRASVRIIAKHGA